MRRSRYAGLNACAKQLVQTACKVEVVGSLSAVFEPLRRYTLPDGRVFTEYQQEVVQSITNVYFVSLHDREGNKPPEFLWTPAEMRTW